MVFQKAFKRVHAVDTVKIGGRPVSITFTELLFLVLDDPVDVLFDSFVKSYSTRFCL